MMFSFVLLMWIETLASLWLLWKLLFQMTRASTLTLVQRIVMVSLLQSLTCSLSSRKLLSELPAASALVYVLEVAVKSVPRHVKKRLQQLQVAAAVSQSCFGGRLCTRSHLFSAVSSTSSFFPSLFPSLFLRFGSLKHADDLLGSSRRSDSSSCPD